MADVSVSFPVTDTNPRFHPILTLDFSVDGLGNVTLDATTSNGGVAPQAVVNAWDGPVGTLTDPSLFGTSFSLVGVGVGGDGNIWTQAKTGASGGMGVGGNNNNVAINGQGAETIQWTFTGTGTVSFKSFSYDNRVAYGTSNLRVVDSDTATTYMLPNTSLNGTIDLSSAGFSIDNGQTLGFTTAAGLVGGNDVAGASLYGFSFDVTPIPEPSTFGLIAVFGGGFLLIKRRFMR
jgi:hypothetical protein